MTDPIADMLTRIRNASHVKKQEVVLPFSKIKMAIAKILVDRGYLEKAEEKKDKHSYLVLTLKYVSGIPAITDLKRISKPGHRRYVKSEDIKTVLNGFGLAIYSTPKGLLANEEARKMKVGGELLCEVY
jgi:small subunit ribosomal protein S8